MNLSDDRINHLSHLLIGELKRGGVQFSDEIKVLIELKRGIHEFGELLDKFNLQVRQKIASLKRQIPEGSREWDLLYKQYFDEELVKKGL